MSQGHPATGTAGFGAGAGAGMALEQEERALGIQGASLLLIPIIPMENPLSFHGFCNRKQENLGNAAGKADPCPPIPNCRLSPVRIFLPRSFSSLFTDWDLC